MVSSNPDLTKSSSESPFTISSLNSFGRVIVSDDAVTDDTPQNFTVYVKNASDWEEIHNYIINENDRNIANNVQQLLPQQEQPNQIGNVQNNNDINQDRVDAFNGEYLRLTRTLNNQINQDRRNNFNPYNFEGLNNNQNNQEVINAVNQRMQEIAGELGDRLIVPPINHANNNFALQ